MGGHLDSITLVNKPQQRLETPLYRLRIQNGGKQMEIKGACSAARPVHWHVYDRSASNHDQCFRLNAL